MTAIEEMLMMAPLFCRRMMGITCLAAKIQLLRLMAMQRSSASSVRSSNSASPPARRLGDHGLEFGVGGGIGLEGQRRAAPGGDHVDRLLRRCEVVIHAQHY